MHICKRMGHTQENCFSLNNFPNKTANVFKAKRADYKFFDEEYQDYMR